MKKERVGQMTYASGQRQDQDGYAYSLAIKTNYNNLRSTVHCNEIPLSLDNSLVIIEFGLNIHSN